MTFQIQKLAQLRLCTALESFWQLNLVSHDREVEGIS